MCTRVSCSTDQDWEKMRRFLKYLKGTETEYLTLGMNGIDLLETWIDASYAIYQYMKIHTGGVISMGGGSAMSKSSKQKINTKSSTEAEMIGTSDYIPNTVQGKCFLEHQGYIIQES